MAKPNLEQCATVMVVLVESELLSNLLCREEGVGDDICAGGETLYTRAIKRGDVGYNIAICSTKFGNLMPGC